MTDAVSILLIDLDARIEELQQFRDRLLATLGEVRVAGKAPAPVAESPGPGSEALPPGPPRSGDVYAPKSKYIPLVAAALADGPLTYTMIADRIGTETPLWYEAFKKCPWFERADPEKKASRGHPAMWPLSPAGRTATAESAGTATTAPSTARADCVGGVFTPPA